LSESEANPKIEHAYKAVVEKYPDCTSVKDASLKLGWLNFKKGRWTEAVGYFELCLEKYPEKYRPPHVLYALGRAYEEIGQLDKAAQAYHEFIKSIDPSDPRIETVKARLEKLGVTSND